MTRRHVGILVFPLDLITPIDVLSVEQFDETYRLGHST